MAVCRTHASLSHYNTRFYWLHSYRYSSSSSSSSSISWCWGDAVDAADAWRCRVGITVLYSQRVKRSSEVCKFSPVIDRACHTEEEMTCWVISDDWLRAIEDGVVWMLIIVSSPIYRFCDLYISAADWYTHMQPISVHSSLYQDAESSETFILLSCLCSQCSVLLFNGFIELI